MACCWTEHPWNHTIGCRMHDYLGRDWQVCCMAHPDNGTISIEKWTWRAWPMVAADDADRDCNAEYILAANDNGWFLTKEHAMEHAETMLISFGFKECA